MTERTTITISIQTKGKWNSLKSKIEEILGKTISDDKLLQILLATKGDILTLE